MYITTPEPVSRHGIPKLLRCRLITMPRRLAGVSVVILWLLILVLSWSPTASSQDIEASGEDLLEMSLDQLLNIEITSVSKMAEKRTEAAAAIHVLTSDDIRRSGATNIPDLLRTVPGMDVAQIDASRWSVTARGSAGRFGNKLLVLIDGRTIYTPFFSGVYWEANDVMLEDVDRIEIIRGPGGTLWGANAVNGVINIVTKHTQDTQGGLLVVGGGTEEHGFGALRYGGKVRDLGHYRVYGKFFVRDEGGDFHPSGTGLTGGLPNDDWQMGQGGGRLDLDLSERDTLSIHGDVYRTSTGITHDLTFFAAPNVRRVDSTSTYSGYNLVARWNRVLSDRSDTQLQVNYDQYHVDDTVVDEQRYTFDIDFQHRIGLGTRHEIVWGAGYRMTTDDFEATAFETITPDRRTDNLLSAFVQDQITLTDSLKLTVGTKLEHNDYSGMEVQPSARMAWTPNERHTVWGAISRAVRTPSRSEADIRLNFLTSTSTPGSFVVVFGNDDFDSEKLLAYELGYRVVMKNTLALDFAAFYNDHNDLRFTVAGAPFIEPTPPPSHTVIPFSIVNGSAAETYGFEVTANYKPKPWWMLQLSYSYLESSVTNPQTGSTIEGDVPESQFALLNGFDLPRNVEIDAVLRYVGELSDLGIDSYVTMDARLAWRPNEDLELAIVGRNLLQAQHPEFRPTVVFNVPTEVQRSVYGKVTWHF